MILTGYYYRNSHGKIENAQINNLTSSTAHCPYCNHAMKDESIQSFDCCEQSAKPVLPIHGWDNVDFNVSDENLTNIKSHFSQSRDYPCNEHLQELISKKIITPPHRLGFHQFTDKGLWLAGGLTLASAHTWFREHLGQRRDMVKKAVADNKLNTGCYDVELYRQQQLLNSTLCIVCIETDHQQYIAVSAESLLSSDSLNSLVQLCENLTGSKVTSKKVLCETKYLGSMARYINNKYKDGLVGFNDQVSVFSLSQDVVDNVINETREFKALECVFNKEENFVMSGRWTYEQKRLQRAKRGIEQTLREGSKFGRPKGTSLSEKAFLNKHKEIVDLIKQGIAIKSIVSKTQKSLSTVKRVKSSFKTTWEDVYGI
ncbi:MAG: hypothetical protein HAW67_03540 [Endozoicomonadaceae bacterium]|nr:hypothetical protein [Endozoicomonadaceae bacterium]